jgi:hypothetical protein
MPTKRKRRTRPHMALQPHEIEWLTGIEQPNAGKLWKYIAWRYVERYALLLETHREMVPRGRMKLLLADLERWSA